MNLPYRSIINYIINAGLAISFGISFVTGLLKWPGLTQTFGWHIPTRSYTALHDWSGLVMALLVFAHIVLHWRWIVCMTKKIFKRNEEKCD